VDLEIAGVDRAFFARDPLAVAPELLGMVVATRDPYVAIRITEVEAYRGIGQDPSSHAFRRQTLRNAPMFQLPGSLYVYFTYGMHWCINVVAHAPSEAGAVLIRAGEVVAGSEVVAVRRPTARQPREWARGPARLAKALNLAGEANGVDLLNDQSSVMLIDPPGRHRGSARQSLRIGLSGEGALLPWRFELAGEATVSRRRS
jgi:DNA-3-methyladenine glycosylase